MLHKFSKKEIQRLGCNDDETELILSYQRRFPIFIDGEDKIEKFCIDAKTLWEELDKPQGQYAQWIRRKFQPYGFIQDIDYIVSNEKCGGVNGGSITNNKYTLTLDMAKQLAMIDKKEAGFIARRYFILMEQIVRDNKEWLEVRNPEKKDYNNLCKIVSQNIYKHSARPADGYDYSREANILNIIATGSKAQDIRNFFNLGSQNELTRDSLEKEYNERLAFLQKQDMLYLGIDMPIVERVKMLMNTFDVAYPDAKPILPWKTKDDMTQSREDLVTSLCC